MTFLMASLMFFLISCSINKKLSKSSGFDDYKDIPGAEKYFDFKGDMLSKDTAEFMISEFYNHKYGWPRRKKIDTAWASFNPKLLKQIANDKNVFDIKFCLATQITNDSTYRFPTIIIRLQLLKYSEEMNGKDSTGQLSNLLLSKPLYFKAGTLCPPPPGNCRIMPQ